MDITTAYNYLIALIKKSRLIVTFSKNYLSKKKIPGYCNICGTSTIFSVMGENLRETFTCQKCNSNSRNRHIAKIMCDLFNTDLPCNLKDVITSNPNLKIYEAQSRGGLHDVFSRLDGYVCSEFFENIKTGEKSAKGIRCENLECLTFEDNSFDIIITQDVFEHIRQSELAWKEVHRILKPSGYHIFTIPYSENKKTEKRVKIKSNKDIFVLPKVYHGDSIRSGLVYTDFGYDLIPYLDSIGFSTSIAEVNHIDSKNFQIHCSKVFISRKKY